MEEVEKANETKGRVIERRLVKPIWEMTKKG